MNSDNFVNKLRDLKKIEPSKEWMSGLKESLISEFKEDNLSENSIFSQIPLFFSQRRFATAFAIFLFLTIGFSTVVVNASRSSLPGDTLYPVKIIAERTRIKLVLNSQTRINLESQSYYNRIMELDTVLVMNGDVNKKEAERVAVEAQKQIISVKAQLSRVNDELSPEKAVEVAKAVSRTTSEAQKTLQVKITENNGLPITEKLNEVIEISNETEINALRILAKNANQDQSKEIARVLGGKVVITEERLKAVEEKVAANEESGGNQTNAVLIMDQSNKAKQVLEEVKESLNNNDLNGALDKYKLSNELAKSAVIIANAVTSTPDAINKSE